MRYKDTGNVHKDFHLATYRTVSYILDNYDMTFLRELFKRTAQKVYKSIWEDLKKGDYSQLTEHWIHYYTRERGRFIIEDNKESYRFLVKECPAVSHLKKNGVEITDRVYLPTILLNEFWSQDTPFIIGTDILGEGKYEQIIQRRTDASQ
jgi:hypothetical protein